VTLPTNGKRLYQPYYSGSLAELSPQEWESIPSQYRFPILRPAYTDKTLAIALRGGVDPTGRRFDPIMPRYRLEEQDMAVLIAYLKELSSVPAPGVTETTLRFATVIAGEVSPADRAATTLPDAIRGFTCLTYPYRLPRDEDQYAKFAKAWLKSRKAPIDDRRISTRMYSLMSLMAQTLMHLKPNYYRDNLLDVISMFPDHLYPDYERLSFGPGQQYASKGCYIVQVTQGPDPHLVKKSDWVIH